MKTLAITSRQTEAGGIICNLIIGEENGIYTVWTNWSDHQQVFCKEQSFEIAVGTYNLWRERYAKDGHKLCSYKEHSQTVKGHENTKHPFLTL